MRILIVHNRYQQKGGEDSVVAAEEALLRSHGHTVELLLVDNDHIQGTLNQALAGVQSIYSKAGKKRMHATLAAFHPEVVHVHNFFPTLSPAVFLACSEARIPVVHTLHNFRIECAASTLFRNGEVCDDCITSRSFLPGVRHACYRGSRLGSAISGFGMAMHSWMGTWSSHVSAYIALTEFTADTISTFRIPREKIHVKPNFVVDQGIGTGDGDYALFVGRLSPEKGLETLIAADQAGLLSIDVVVLGDGPLRQAVEQAASRPGSRLCMKGFATHDTIIHHMKQARVLLVPSLWYEAGLPLVSIEALSTGLPVIAAEVGNALVIGKAEMGLLYPAGDARGLAKALLWFIEQPSVASSMRQKARDYYLTTHTPEKNYTRLHEIYTRVIRDRQPSYQREL